MAKAAQNIRVKKVKGHEYFVARIVRDGKLVERSLGARRTTRISEARRRLQEILDEDDDVCGVAGSSPFFGEIWSDAIDHIARSRESTNQ